MLKVTINSNLNFLINFILPEICHNFYHKRSSETQEWGVIFPFLLHTFTLYLLGGNSNTFKTFPVRDTPFIFLHLSEGKFIFSLLYLIICV